MLARKGHIPTLLLFAEALILILTAWYTFFTLDDNLGSYANSFRIATSSVEEDYQYVLHIAPLIVGRAIELRGEGDFEASFNASLLKVAGEVDDISSLRGDFFGKIRNKEYIIKRDGSDYVFVMQKVSVYSGTSGVNAMTRTFGISIRFNEKTIIAEGL